MPATIVTMRETRRMWLSVARGTNGLYRSSVNAAAIEFNDDDIAAAKIAATTRPERPVGRGRVMKSGKTWSAARKGAAGPPPAMRSGREEGKRRAPIEGE